MFRNKARAVVCAALGFGMAAGTALPQIVMAAEVTYGKGNITINNIKGNQTKFVGYQIFKANVVDSSTTDTSRISSDPAQANKTGKVETNIVYVNDSVKYAVETVIKANGGTAADIKTPQDAAVWIQKHVTSDSAADVAAGKGTRVTNGSIANQLADALDNLTNKTNVAAGTKTNLDEGYWLFVTDTSSIGTDEAGTAPIFAVVGGGDVTVTEKTNIPTVNKFIRHDEIANTDPTDLDKKADSHIGQAVDYDLYGSVADNVLTYKTYFYQFTDKVSKGLTVDKRSVKVYVYDSAAQRDADPSRANAKANKNGGHDVTSKFETQTLTVDPATGESTLTVGTKDLLAAYPSAARDGGTGTGITKDSVVVVTYQAKINSQAVIGGEGNPNTVKLTYSNNPNNTSTGDTHEEKVRDYTYALKLVKIDRSTEEPLQGFQFTIQASGPDDTASKGKYLQADGTLGDQPYKFTTDKDGNIQVNRIDVGTYHVHEVTTRDNYLPAKDFSFTIKATYDSNGKLTGLTNTVAGQAVDDHSAIAGKPDGKVGDNRLTGNGDNAADMKTGLVTVTVGDVKELTMPLTGMTGTQAIMTYGSIIAVISVGAYLYTRRKKDMGNEDNGAQA